MAVLLVCISVCLVGGCMLYVGFPWGAVRGVVLRVSVTLSVVLFVGVCLVGPLCVVNFFSFILSVL